MRSIRTRNNRRLILLGLLMLAGLMPGAGSLAWAHTFVAEEQLTLPADQVINDSWYAVGRDVQIAGRIHRDALVAGSQLSFSGKVDQDLMFLAQNADISGMVAGELRAGAETLLVTAQVGQGAVLFAKELRVGLGAEIQGGLVAGAQILTLSGVVHGRTELFGEQVHLEGLLDGQVTVHSHTLQVGRNARLLGTLTYYGDTPLKMSPGAQVGKVVWIGGHGAPEEKKWYSSLTGKKSADYTIKLVFAITFLLLGALLVWLLPVSAQRYAGAIERKIWPSFGWGLLILIGVPLVCLLFCITLIGIPLAVILGVLYVLGLFLSKLGVGYCLGRLIFKQRPQLHPVLVFLVGYALLAGVGFIPYFGNLVSWLAVIIGLGGLISAMGAQAVPAPAGAGAKAAQVLPTPSAPVPAATNAAVPGLRKNRSKRVSAPAAKSRTRTAKTAKTTKRPGKIVRKAVSRKRSRG